MTSWTSYILIGFAGGFLFFAAGAWALHWAAKHGQFNKMEEGARSIFDEEEPVGRMTDRFPNAPRRQAKSKRTQPDVRP